MAKNSVAIIICTYNGENFLTHQLESLKNQTYKSFDLFISDDGSDDNTIDVIHSFIKKNSHINIHLLNGPKKGFAKNFISSLTLVSNFSENGYKYYAFCDQDDVWDKNKVEKGIKILEKYSKEIPCLYCSRTRYVNSDGIIIGKSPLFRRLPSFNNAMVQSIAGGNTMIFNSTLSKEICKLDLSEKIISHDWISYIITTALDGMVYYDELPRISYRQHNKNIIGSNNSFNQIFKRYKSMMAGDYGNWINANIKQLENLNLGDDKVEYIESFKQISSNSIYVRIRSLIKTKIYRQTLIGNLSLIVAVLLNKFK